SLLSDETLALAVGPLGIFVLDCGDRDHLAVVTLAAQPSKKDAFEQLGVETVGHRTPMLARYGYARCMDNVRLDAAGPEPARQPKTVPALDIGGTTVHGKITDTRGEHWQFYATDLRPHQRYTLSLRA